MIERKKGMFDRLRLAASWHQINGPLFRKYVALFLAVVFIVLLTNVLFEVGFSYQEQKDSLIRIQREQAEAASAKISQFIREIESQVGWTTQLPWSAGTLDQRRFDGLRLLRQAPAVAEIAMLDPGGKEQLRLSRIAMDEVGRHARPGGYPPPFSCDPAVAPRTCRAPAGVAADRGLRPRESATWRDWRAQADECAPRPCAQGPHRNPGVAPPCC